MLPCMPLYILPVSSVLKPQPVIPSTIHQHRSKSRVWPPTSQRLKTSSGSPVKHKAISQARAHTYTPLCQWCSHISKSSVIQDSASSPLHYLPSSSILHSGSITSHFSVSLDPIKEFKCIAVLKENRKKSRLVLWSLVKTGNRKLSFSFNHFKV